MSWLLVVIGVSLSDTGLTFMRPPPPIEQWYSERLDCLAGITATVRHPDLDLDVATYAWHVYCVDVSDRPRPRAPPASPGRGT